MDLDQYIKEEVIDTKEGIVNAKKEIKDPQTPKRQSKHRSDMIVTNITDLNNSFEEPKFNFKNGKSKPKSTNIFNVISAGEQSSIEELNTILNSQNERSERLLQKFMENTSASVTYNKTIQVALKMPTL